MAVTKSAYNIIKKAVIIRVKRGEDINEVISSYPKLSDKQAAQLLVELEEDNIIN